MIDTEQVKNLIRQGFELEVISFELDIPMDTLKKYKSEMNIEPEKRKVTTTKLKQTTTKKETKKPSTISFLIDNYNRIYNEVQKEEKEEIRLPSEKEKEIIEDTIENIKRITDTRLTYEDSLELVKYAKRLSVLPVSIDQLEDVYRVLTGTNNGYLPNIKISYDKTSYNKGLARGAVAKKLGELIDKQAKETESLEELEKLSKALPGGADATTVYGIRSRIDNRILVLKRQKQLEDFLNNVSPEFLQIVDNLVEGTLDIDDAKKVLTKEAETSHTSLEQLITKIKMKLESREAIKNPKETIKQLAKLNNGNVLESVRTVIVNLTNNNEFEMAKETCYKCRKIDKENPGFQAEMRNCEQNIIRAEIGYLFMRMTTEDEVKQIQTFEDIKEMLTTYHIALNTIPLGNNKDGSKSITLADVYGKRDVDFLRD